MNWDINEDDLALFLWSLKSPDLTPYDFFWLPIIDLVYVPWQPKTLEEIWEEIRATVMMIKMTTIQNVWNELNYYLDVCHVTQGVHIDHL